MRKENVELKEKVVLLETRVNDLDQYHRRINIEVAGVPESEGENVREKVLKVLKEAAPTTSDDDIDVTHRLGQKREEGGAVPGRPRPIIVRFATRRARDAVYDGRRKLKETSTRRMGLSRMDGKVFINENLAPTKKALLKKANEKRKQAGWRFLWTVNGTILVRKSQNVPPVAVNREEDLHKIT